MKKTARILSIILLILVTIGGIGIYFWTIYLGYVNYDILGAIACIIFPVISQLVFMYQTTVETGMFLNLYNVTILIHISIIFIVWICSLIASK